MGSAECDPDGIAQDRRLRAAPNPDGVIGSSRPWRQALAYAAKVAATEATVLLTGESGNREEVVAHVIHKSSRRAGGPFVGAQLRRSPRALLESELFGYEKGAFTGAVSARPGRLEQAAGGTLFLDEVGEMQVAGAGKVPPGVAGTEFQRLGGTRVQKADVRVIAATNRDLHAALATRRVSARTSTTGSTSSPSVSIAARAAGRYPGAGRVFRYGAGAGGVGRPAAGITREAHERLLAHSWPGNVRELRNAVERGAHSVRR